LSQTTRDSALVLKGKARSIAKDQGWQLHYRAAYINVALPVSLLIKRNGAKESKEVKKHKANLEDQASLNLRLTKTYCVCLMPRVASNPMELMGHKTTTPLQANSCISLSDLDI